MGGEDPLVLVLEWGGWTMTMQGDITVRSAVPAYPVSFVLTYLLAAFLDADISVFAVLRVTVIVLAATLVLVGALWAAFGATRGGLAATALILVARSSELLHAAAAVALLATALTAWRLARRMWPNVTALRQPNAVLNAFSVILVSVTVAGGLVNGRLVNQDVRQPQSPRDLQEAAWSDGRGLPDIYLIMLDGYPRADTLNRLFDFDNQPFLSDLTDRGFDVIDDSSSNYIYTQLTLASMQQMRYVDDVVSLRTAINQNPAWGSFRQRGYLIAASKPPWENVAMRSADVMCGSDTNDYEQFLVNTTLVGRFIGAIRPHMEADALRDSVNGAFDCLRELSDRTAQPKLVFIHVPAPHLPIVFDANGGPASDQLFADTRPEVGASEADFRRGYAQEIEYLNRRVRDAIDVLQRRSDDPVIVVFSDHGSESRLNWGDATKSDMAERFSNLFAAHTPDHPGLFPCGTTPIEIFPTLLRGYLGLDVAVPERRYFISQTDSKLAVTKIADPDVRSCE